MNISLCEWCEKPVDLEKYGLYMIWHPVNMNVCSSCNDKIMKLIENIRNEFKI